MPSSPHPPSWLQRPVHPQEPSLSVSSGIQTPPDRLENSAVPRFFNSLFRCLEILIKHSFFRVMVNGKLVKGPVI